MYLVKDSYLLKGMLAFFVSSAIGFSLIRMLTDGVAQFPLFLTSGGILESISATNPCTAMYQSAQSANLDSWIIISKYLMLTLAGGLGIGFFSTIAEACPFRQHVMAGEGSPKAYSYVFGFYAGVFVFALLVLPILDKILWI